MKKCVATVIFKENALYALYVNHKGSLIPLVNGYNIQFIDLNKPNCINTYGIKERKNDNNNIK